MTRSSMTLLAFLAAGSAAATWQAEAPIAVAGAGIATVVLPPALHRESAGGLDLDLLGADGEPRPFDVYFREDHGETSLDLRPSSVRLVGLGFVWEARIPERDRVLARAIEIVVAAGDYVGSVRVEARRDGRWTELARDAAVYATRGTERSRVEIAPAVWEAFRLTFTAHGKRPVPVDRVTVVGTRTGEDFATAALTLPARLTRTGGGGWLDAQLPGSGLHVVAVEVTPATRFAGGWSVDRETIRAGQRAFLTVAQGSEAALGHDLTVRMPVNAVWPGTSLRIRLMAGDRRLGGATRVTVRVRLPRVSFFTDGTGAFRNTYRIVAGSGRDVAVQPVHLVQSEATSSAPNPPMTEASLGTVVKNPRWKPEDLVAQYGLGGASFSAAGFRWRAPVRVPGPGYIRIALSERASLDGRASGLRIVRNGMQVPFLLDEGEVRSVTLSVDSGFDASTNTTIWRMALPRASAAWLGLRIRSSGIFSRVVGIGADSPVPADLPVPVRLTWTHAAAGPTDLDVPLGVLRSGETRLRITVAHGQNRPIPIESAVAFYRAPGLSFLADAADGYEVYGGHPGAGDANWDLDLVAGRLADILPAPASLGEPMELDGGSGWTVWLGPFGEARWGLYAVLGALTLALIAIIVRLFPAPPASRRRR